MLNFEHSRHASTVPLFQRFRGCCCKNIWMSALKASLKHFASCCWESWHLLQTALWLCTVLLSPLRVNFVLSANAICVAYYRSTHLQLLFLKLVKFFPISYSAYSHFREFVICTVVITHYVYSFLVIWSSANWLHSSSLCSIICFQIVILCVIVKSGVVFNHGTISLIPI